MIALCRPDNPAHFYVSGALGFTGSERTVMIGGLYSHRDTGILDPADGIVTVPELRNLKPRAEASYEITMTPVDKADKGTVSVKIGKRTLILAVSFRSLEAKRN